MEDEKLYYKGNLFDENSLKVKVNEFNEVLKSKGVFVNGNKINLVDMPKGEGEYYVIGFDGTEYYFTKKQGEFSKYLKLKGFSKGLYFSQKDKTSDGRDYAERLVMQLVVMLNKERQESSSEIGNTILTKYHKDLDRGFYERFERLSNLLINNEIPHKLSSEGNIKYIKLVVNDIMLIVTPNLIYDVNRKFIIYTVNLDSDEVKNNLAKYEGRLDEFFELFKTSRDRRVKI